MRPLILFAAVLTLMAGGPRDGKAATGETRDPEALSKPLPPRPEIRKVCPSVETPIVRFVVATDGTTTNHEYVHGTGCPAGDKLLLKYLRKWRYKPGLKDGKPVECWLTTVVNWG